MAEAPIKPEEPENEAEARRPDEEIEDAIYIDDVEGEGPGVVVMTRRGCSIGIDVLLLTTPDYEEDDDDEV